MKSRCHHLALSIALSLGLALGAWAQAAPSAASDGSNLAPPAAAVPVAADAPAGSASAPISYSARRVYEQARSQLVQIRTVLKGRASQTSVGSGFFVSRDGHIVTNFTSSAKRR